MKCYINEYISISIRETFLINLSKYDKGFPTLSYERSNSVHGIMVEIIIAKCSFSFNVCANLTLLSLSIKSCDQRECPFLSFPYLIHFFKY